MSDTEAEVTVGEEAATIESGEGYTVVERGVQDWPENTVLIQTDEPVSLELATLFGDENGEGGEAVTHDFTYFIASSIEDVIEGPDAQLAAMLGELDLDEDSTEEEPRITLDESSVFGTNAEAADGGPQTVKVDGGSLQDALDEFAERHL